MLGKHCLLYSDVSQGSVIFAPSALILIFSTKLVVRVGDKLGAVVFLVLLSIC